MYLHSAELSFTPQGVGLNFLALFFLRIFFIFSFFLNVVRRYGSRCSVPEQPGGRSFGSSAVLLELLRSVDKEKLSTVQFLRNGTVRLTFKSTADCNAAVSSGISYGGVAPRVVGVEAKSRLVYLRDCPTEVPDIVVSGFFSSFGEVHSVTRSTHDGFPGIFDGNRLVKMTLTKNTLVSVRVSGFDCRMWYRRQLPFCSICKKSGHRGKSCPLDSLFRRYHQPGHVARECCNAWGAAHSAQAAYSSSTATASAAEVPSSDAPLASDAALAYVASSVASSAAPSSDDVPPLSVLLSSAPLAPENEEADMEFVPISRCVLAMKKSSGVPPPPPPPPPLLHLLMFLPRLLVLVVPAVIVARWGSLRFLALTFRLSPWTCHLRTIRSHRSCPAPLMRFGMTN